MKQSGSTRERIYQHGVRLFAKKGYAATGLRELANDAEVNLAMVSYFFGGKNGLLKEILADFLSGYIEILEKNLTRDVDLDEKITVLVREAVVFVEENKEQMIIMLTELPHDELEITQYKGQWTKKAMGLIMTHVCGALEKEYGVTISPALVGPVMVCLVASRFLLAPVIEEMNPPGYGEMFKQQYPDQIAAVILGGLHGLARSQQEITKQQTEEQKQ